MIAMWHYAQGIAAVRQHKLEDARRHQEAVVAATRDPAIEKMKVWDRYSVIHGVRIAERILTAELAREQKDFAAATAALKEAVVLEESIPYDEPPGWHAPVRQTLGAVLLQAKKPAEAEAVFLEELRRNPENGWSLYGLEQSLRAQGKQEARTSPSASSVRGRTRMSS